MITISFFNLLNQNYLYFKKLFDISRKLDLDPTLKKSNQYFHPHLKRNGLSFHLMK